MGSLRSNWTAAYTQIACIVLGAWVAGCEANCPSGSIEVGNRCEPIPKCEDGASLDAGACTGSPVDDGGGDSGDGDGDSGQGPVDGGDASEPNGDGSVDGDVPDQDASDGHVIDGGDPCASHDCGEHGSCVAEGNAARCECDRGYDGPLCATCKRGFAPDGSRCFSICEDPGFCNFRPCDDSGEEPVCLCGRAYSASDPLCRECAEGYLQDPGDLQCYAACTGACAHLEYCNEALEVPACDCLPGYERDGEECRWLGDGTDGVGVVNGALTGTAGWTTHHVTIASGKATFSNSGSGLGCELGSIEQVIKMPSLAESQPFAVEIDVESDCAESNGDLCPPLLLEVGDAVTRLPVAGGVSSQTLRACLGLNGYGEGVLLRIQPSIAKGVHAPTGDVEAFSCAVDEWPSIAAVRVVAATATTCPIASSIANASFDSTTQWSLDGATIAGGSLTLQAEGQASTPLIVPPRGSSGPSALHISYSGSDSGAVRVLLDGLLLKTVVWAAGAAGERGVCLPDWTQASGHLLRLQATAVSTITEIQLGDGVCGDGVFDAGFERPNVNAFVQHSSWEGATGDPVVDHDAAHSGSWGMSMTSANNGIRTLMRMPDLESGVDAGLAFQFWYRRTNPALQSTFELRPSIGSPFTINSDSWQPRTDCLPRSWARQPMVIYVATTLTGASGELHLDDMGPVLSPSCD